MATIEIDGKTIEVENGKMIIEVADDEGIYIPRFCYHKKLSVAANCRMCLVEVENGRKTVPACATPVSNGMKVFTKSEAALRSQEAVMEFLLINHPLDCPICDQGGECELQDISVGFGQDSSEYAESKRSVVDDNLGELISTEMTRCIQCTRCVRFGSEIAGFPELGGIGRGEKLQIGTYIQHSMQSEVSGNVIDLCPVGALTSKPYRFTARAWEMNQSPSIAPHDCLGSNVYLHTRRNELMRVVPREKEEINETWLSDRDRYSYLGLNSSNRLGEPMIKKNGQWEVVDWQTAITFAASGLAQVIKTHGPEQLAAFSTSSATVEEMYLLQKLMRNLGVENIDHRLRQTDFRDQDMLPVEMKNGISYAALEQQAEVFIVGCNIDREVPLAGVRVRKAFVNGAKISSINVVDYAYHFDVENKVVVSPQELPIQLATLLAAVADGKKNLSEQALRLTVGLEPDDKIKEIAVSLSKPDAVIVTGEVCENHPEAAVLRTLVELIAEYSGAKILRFTTGANSAGGSIAGMLPHRGVAGKAIAQNGLNVQEALNNRLKGYLLMGAEPGFDFANPHGARQSMLAAEFVVSLSAYQTESIKEYANVILPISPYSETSGTYINIDGTWQTTKGAVVPLEESRPAWKVLRVIANVLHCDGFEYSSSEEVLEELKTNVSMMKDVKKELFYPESLPALRDELVRVGEWPIYRVDAIVRNAEELQSCGSSEKAVIRINTATAKKFNLGDSATVSQGDIEITLPLQIDDRIALDTVWVANAMLETVDLGHAYASITIK
ncbi:MAG: NADH-quinone oxidoreductase subunit NuoG [Legionellaceae bacterium]|nr:NADH-quinone oxidoreductase subunit NuoG [Legionellaceae bacterium]